MFFLKLFCIFTFYYLLRNNSIVANFQNLVYSISRFADFKFLTFF